MRVLWINHRCPKHPQAGGAEEYVFQISRRLVKMGHEVTLLAEKPSSLPEHEVIDGVEIVRKGGFLTLHLWAPLYVAKHSREYDVIIDNVAHVFPFYSSKFTFKPTIAVVHHVNGKAINRVMPQPLHFLGIAAEKSLPHMYRSFIAVSRSTEEDLINLGVNPDRISVVYNGVDHEVYKPGEKSERPLVLWLNRFVKYKNPDHAVRAFSIVKKKIPEALFVMAGDGPERPRAERLAKQLGVEVEFVGKISVRRKVELLQRAWVCVYTSEIEGWGLVALEAAASGTPCVGYAVGGLRESIIDGVTGFLARPGDIGDLANKIVRILNNAELLKRLTENAFRYAQNFDWNNSAERFLEVINSVTQ
ncbi:glycosyltransferase (type 1) [Pyrobaculum aerophilum str. IM2]|uniref:Glycosyltransferase (Type 1) n=2 Tax=Pyrobaculum aerophilum TaxID=13773 RepID=Q8ZZ46_PYRAE|nr:glycosyltransferase family 4 protein [Pyrobaculum aerophilum]AAL62795.1 glycosyltransferase (type 1) [Pyrobaculum aerophilum str. IM2]HII46860.1 glycosyltransferase family 4 protein [Pyrobaculum aerophilum]